MISNDIGQIASLYAMLHRVKTIYFGGFFLRHHPVSMHTVGYSVNYWSKGQVQVRFLRHEGYLGAIGAFLCQGVEGFKTEEYSWLENLYGSSGFTGPKKDDGEGTASYLDLKQLEIDRFEKKLRFCPLLLDPQKYVADTVDLTEDGDAREYWLHCLEESLPKFTERAIRSQSESPDVAVRAEAFKSEFLSRLHKLQDNPYAYGNLTVRSLLDLREHCLAEFDFHDPYLKQKRKENEQAVELFPARLQHLSQLNWEKRLVQLAIGFLAGNVFDWGAKEVALLMEEGKLNFDSAIAAIGPRPWLMDNLDEWLKRMRGPPHRCAAIFIDNSGVDIILGVMPFVEELLRRGTKVLLCANNRPVLNDVTYAELELILQRVSPLSEVLSDALANGKLECLDSGQGSPCLDLTKLNKKVTDAMKKNLCDLLVLEGMGRAVHTNLFAEFKCECLKVAVLKNRWLANKLGGDMYAVIFRYESPGEDSRDHFPPEAGMTAPNST